MPAPPAETPPAWTVSVDPLTWALSFAHVQVERRLTPRLSLYVGPSLHLYDGLVPDTQGPWRGYGAEAGLRWFFRPGAPRGAWLMARGVLGWVTTEQATLPEGGTGHAAGLGGYTSGLVGYTAILGPGLVLSGGVGVSWFDYGVAQWGIHGPLPAAHTAVGWAF